MTLPRSDRSLRRSRDSRQRVLDRVRRETMRRLRLENLEERRLLATGPLLIGIQPSSGDMLLDGDVRHEAPTNLLFQFSGNQSIAPNSLNGIQIRRAGADGLLNTATTPSSDDIVIQPGYVGLGQVENQVIMRFSEALPDDLYRIDIYGTGTTPLRNTAGDRFQDGQDRSINFELDLGAQVIAVVPQPIETLPNGTLTQRRNQIAVYFNNDDLYRPDAENPALYKLIFTNDTANNTDDVVFTPTSVTYDSGSDKAVLTFATDLVNLPHPVTGNPMGAGTFRLRIGTDEGIPEVPWEVAPTSDVGSSFGTAEVLGILGGQSKLVSAAIDPSEFLLDFPGGNDEPGHRHMPEEVAGGYDNHINPAFGADTTAGVTTILYNFQADYGYDDQGLPLKNLITPTQKQRAREALEVWARYIGVQFLETSNQGLTIVTGDPHALDPNAPDVVNHALEKPIVDSNFMVKVDPDFQDSLLILDNAHQWNDQANGDWYRTALTGIGFMLGLERATDLPSSTLMAYASTYTYGGTVSTETVAPGNHDIVHGQYLHRADSNDIDMYRFEIAAGQRGVFTAETFAERQPNASLLDTLLILYRENADGSHEVIARNDNYYSDDSYLELELSAGIYFLGVSASGNDSYNPEFPDTGFGGRSQGPYDLRIGFQADPEAGSALRDVRPNGSAGTVLDGDADGVPGGAYNFWFRSVPVANTIIVDKQARTLDAAFKGVYPTISGALTRAAAGDIVRIVGNGGVDGNLATLQDNLAYQIGPGPLPNQILSDGKTLDVPRGVTMMVDAGAIFKMNESRIGVGSSLLSVDRSAGAFQVLGIPGRPVYFTSYYDEAIGLDTYAPVTTPRPGHWGGIIYRNDLDNAEERFNYEREGIFLNYVNHADIRYGGGNVVVDSVRQIVTPVQMTEARPTITNNMITLSADAPISADPDSFEETNFHAPRYQLKGTFTSDYDRVGPELHGNRLVENSTNGLFVRITTPAGDAQKQLTVSGRFDDTDVVHILSENLVIAGKSGEPILELERPPVTVVTLATRSGGQLEPGTYHYKVVFVDTNGFEGRPSEATSAITVSAASPNRSVRLDKLPAAGGDFVARRIYRSTTGVAGPYVLVAQINTSDAVYTDTKSLASLDASITLQRDVPTVVGLTLTASTTSGGLAAGSYNYRITYLNAAENEESPSSDPTVTRVLTDLGKITLGNITRPQTSGYDIIRIYRSESDGEGPYTLVGEIPATDTSFVDEGVAWPIAHVMSPVLYGVSRARMNARLTIDPGMVVKLEGSRIETSFGAQLIAEGKTGQEIIFTSRSDDRYGAGGTFDTSGDGSARTPAPGDWGGLYIGLAGSASIDSALLTFGGGVTKIEGTFKAFNILEVHQSNLRLVNSVIEHNADGQAGQGPADRFGRGANLPATIYVRGAQPILVNNIIQNNDELALTINANSFTNAYVPDPGRSRGEIGLTGDFSSNTGPLVRGNRMANNPLNGMDIRGEVLTTQSIWDDTDIVHVLRDEQIVVPDFHTEVGLRLQSSSSSSLVVKMAGKADNFDPYIGAGFTATGRQLDIDDRIGGTLQIVGQPDFPVILTSLSDDTVGAGFQPNGATLKDTNNNGWATLPAAGDWRSVRLEQFANDRNVELILETESPGSTAPGENATPSSAQHVGGLAPFEYGGDENLRLGFDIRGLLNERNDVDVYSFDATAGTQVWLDIDRTTNTLNSVVELVDALGTVIARSDDSGDESLDPSLLFHSDAIPDNAVNPLQETDAAYTPQNASGLAKDFYSLNTYDAGMRVVLPGVAGTRSTYHVRVRSSSQDLDDLGGGLTTGSYQLQIRLREMDEVAGVTVRYADVRYATNGIEVFGLPGHSPLLGEVSEDEEVGGPEDNGQVLPSSIPGTGPQDIGNLFRTDRAAISVAGTIHSLDDIDFYEMQVGYEATAGNLFQHASVVFDLDYASGLSRPDTIVSVFDSFGRLVLIGRNSNVTDDRSAALDDGDLSDLTRGSLGALDPYIGPVALPEATYFVSVSSNARIPTQLLSNPSLRLEPVNTVGRIAEDHIGTSGGSTAADPTVPVLLDRSSFVPASIEDVGIFILHGTGADDEVQISAGHLATGVVSRTVGAYPGKVQDIATDANGNVYTFTTPDEDPAPSDATVGLLRGVNTSAPQYIASRDDGIRTYHESPTTPGVAVLSDVGIRFHAMAYGVIAGVDRLLAVGSRGDADALVRPSGPTGFTNILYNLNPQTGAAISAPQANRTGNARMDGAGTQIVERGILDTRADGGPGGLITGLAIHNETLYALSNEGGVFVVDDPLSADATLRFIGFAVANAGKVDEVEKNNSIASAQDLDRELWTREFDPNIGDALTNTSTAIKHISVKGRGDDPFTRYLVDTAAGGLDAPAGMAINPANGNLYVSSSATDQVLRYDSTTGALLGTFVAAGDGGLDNPADLTFGPDGHLYVASRNTDQILRYDGVTGRFIDVFASGSIDEPTGLVFGPDRTSDGIAELYVSGYASDNVVAYNGASGLFVRTMVQPAAGGLDGPVGLAFQGDRLFVASALTNRVLRFNAGTGAYINAFASGGLNRPQYLLFGPDANGDSIADLYVTSLGSDSVFRFSGQTGALIDEFVYSGNEGLDAPTDLVVTPTGSLLVASRDTDQIFEFNPAGTPTFDFYKFTVANDNDRAIIDIDFGKVAGEPDSFDSHIYVVDGAGAVIASNDDALAAFVGSGGSVDVADSFLDIALPTAGTYYVMVGESLANVAFGTGIGNRADWTDTYTLHISVQSMTPFVGDSVGTSFEGLAVSMRPAAELDGVLVAIDDLGDMFAFTSNGTSMSGADIFQGGRSRISTGVQDVMGLTISNTNMWHISDARYDDDGHGLSNVFDDSRGNASVVTEREENNTPATAHDLELEYWSLGYDSNIGDTQDPPVNTSTTIPHITIKGSGDGTHDFYSFVVTTAGSRGIFDIDMDYDEQLDPHGFMDSEIVLMDEYGNIITWLEDSALPTDGAGGKSILFDPPLEPCLEYVFPAAGTYILAVTKNVNGLIFQPPEEGDFYTLQVSIENHELDGPKAEGGLSYFFGPELTGVVQNATAGEPVVITSRGHGLEGGERVDVQGVGGIAGANGTFTVNVVDDDSFELVDSIGTGSYTGGGTWRFLQIPEDVQGSILSNPFSLVGYSPEDLPTLYVTYLLDADAAANVDLAGVSLVLSNGVRQPLAVKNAGLVNAVPGDPPTWRQARVDLSRYANLDNLRLEFTFNSADDVASAFEGLLIDDIIIGFAERGEMVSNAVNDPSFTINPNSNTTDALTGAYQLEIRPGADAGVSRRPVAGATNSEVLVRTWDTNERHAEQVSLVPSAGSDLTDGDTFTLSDGVTTLTFEFDSDDVVQDGHVRVAFETTFTAQQVARSIRDAINSPAVQSSLKITATISAATIRGVTFADGTAPTDPLYQLVDLAGNAIVGNLRHILQHGTADQNRFRDQGQVIIHSNFVTDSRDFGIVADAGTRDVEPRLATAFLEPHTGAARNLRVLNNQPTGGLAPGVVIENNVINNEGLGGIHVSGNMAPFELTPPSDTDLYLSGEVVRDGTTFTIHGYRTSVTFEFEDISGGALPMGSNVQGGNGWREGNIPVFYRQSGSNYLAPPWVIPPRPYVQAEMAIAIRDAIQSSILVTNATTLHANASLEASRWLSSAIIPDGALWGPPLVSVYVDNVSSVDIPSSTNLDTRRDAQNQEVPVPIGAAAQPFHRVINNTVVGNDGLRAFHPGSGLDEANDQISTAVETWQGRQHNPEYYVTDAVIGDSTETLNDVSLDVDFYRFHMDIGDRVTIDIDAASKSTLDSVIRLFDATGKQVAMNDNGVAPGEKAGLDAYLSYIATAAGTYYLGVSGKGNETYDALSLGNRQGPASTGGYHLELNVLTPQTWVIKAVDGTRITDGTTFTVSDVTRSVTYEFDDVNGTPGVATGNVAIRYDSRPVAPTGFNHRGPGYRAPEMAVAMAEVIGERLTGVTAVALGGIGGATPALPQTPAITGDTSFYGFPGLGHDNPYTPPETSGELYVVVYGATRITGGVQIQPLLNENIDQLLPETGILVSENASPTLMNNLLTNLNAGIWQDASPTTVVGGSMYQYNYVADANIGSANDDFNISVGDDARMFVDAADGNFYPAAGSPAIDSAIDALEERAQFAIVKAAIGIPVSPILAPNLDASGLLRSDDPEVDTPSGQGANVFKDRGGLDRADFVGPDAVLIVPRDNDQAGIDVDPTETVVQLAAGQYDNFTIQLVDGLQSSESGEGVGVNDLTVDSSKVTVTVDGRILEEGVDYIFRYNDITNTIRLTPLAGVWDNTKAYKITLPNQDRFVITMPNGSEVTDGETFVLTDNTGGTVTFEYESGYSLTIPQTLRLRVPTVGNAPGGVRDGQRFTVSAGSLGTYTFEFDSNSPASILPGNIRVDISAAVTQDQVANAIVAALNGQSIGVVARNLGSGVVHFGAPGTYTVNTTLSALTQTGSTGVVADGQTIQITDGANPPVVFEFDSNNAVTAGHVRVEFSLADTTDDLGARLTAVVESSAAGLDPQYVQYLGEGHVLLGGTASHVLDITGAPRLTQSGTPGVQGSTVLVVPPQGTGSGGIADGQKFTIQQRPNAPVVFEFDRDNSVSPGSRPILFTLGSTVDQLAGYIISAIRLAGVGLDPQYLGGGQIALRDTIYHRTDPLSSKLTQRGVPGGVVEVRFIPDESFDATQFAPLILNAIENSLLTDVTTTFRGGNTYFVNGIKSVSGLSNFFVAAIKDNAGNNLQPNQSSNQTHFTILMPGVELDYGDAPSHYGTTVADGGARHVLTVNTLTLGTGVTSEADGMPSTGADADTDDGVDVSLTALNPHYRAPVTVTSSGRGFVNAWIDFNHDGDWSDVGEHALVNVAVGPGANELSIPTPAGALLGDAYARFRLSSESGVSSDGIALDGEVEDYIVTVVPGTPPVADDDAFATTEDAVLDIAAPGVLDGDTDADGDALTVIVHGASEYGADVTVYPDGRLVYDPTVSPLLQALRPGETLIDSFTYRASDGVLPSNLATVRITVSGVADTPVAGDDAYATDEDTILTVPAPGVLANDFDPDAGDAISLVTYDAVSALGATVSVDGQGHVTYNPTGSAALQALPLGDTLVDTFTYTIRDLAGATATATVSVTVSGINDAPVADNDAYATDEDTVLQIDAPGVFDGDVDIESQPLLVDSYQSTSALGATVVLNSDGSFSYDPTGSAQLQALANGTIVNDTFTYTVSDGSLVSNVATVTIRVTGVNDDPVANEDLYGTDEDSLLTIPAAGVLTNDTDIDTGDVLTVGSADSTSMLGAAVTVNANGSFTYDPRQVAVLQAMGVGQSLVDTFTYTVRDAFGGESTAVVSVRVTGLNDRPTVLDDYYIAEEDSVLTVDPAGVLANDSDAESQPLHVATYDVVSQLGAQVAVLPDGSFTYDPTGSAALQGLRAGEIAIDTFTYRASDGTVNSSPATVYVLVNGFNDDPLAVDDHYTTTEDDAFEIPTPGVLANDLDADSTDVLTVVYSDGISAYGAAVSISSVGELFYNPVVSPTLQALKPGESVQDTFTYTIEDLEGIASTATVTVTVTGRNDAPVANADRFTIDEDSLLEVPAPGVLAGDNDIEGDSLQAEPRQLTTALGALVALLADGSFIYDPRGAATLQQLGPGETREDTFTYRATDGLSFSDPVTVTIEVTGVNDLPVAQDDSSLVPRDGSIAYPVLNNDSDIDGTLDPASVVVVNAPAHGTAQVQADGSILYTPTPGYRGPDSVTYRVSDNDGGVSNIATLSLLVNSVPVALDDVAETIRDVPVTINVLGNDSDSDGTLVPGSVTIVTPPTAGSVTVNANGTVRYVPAAGYVGADFFTYTVRDDIGSVSNVARVDINVVANPFPWNNPLRSRDVNGDTFVTPIDALLIINDLNFRGARRLPNPPQPPFLPPPFLDVNRDGSVTPADALLVINYLNSRGEGEGESGAEGEGPSGDLAAAYGRVTFVDGSVTTHQPLARARTSQSVAAPTATSVNAGLHIGQAERLRYAALQDFLAEAAEDDLMDLVANDVSAVWKQAPAEQEALVDLLVNTIQRARKRN